MSADGYTELKFAEVVERQEEVVVKKVFLTSDPDSYFIMTADASQAVTFGPRLDFDDELDEIGEDLPPWLDYEDDEF